MRLTAREKQQIADRLGVDVAIIRRLSTLSARIQRAGVIQCNGADRDKLPGESWEQFDHYRKKCLKLAERREAATVRTAKSVAEKAGLTFFYQSDPRGASVYVSREVMTDTNYNMTGTAVY